MKSFSLLLVFSGLLLGQIRVGTFWQDKATQYSTDEGLLSENVHSIEHLKNGTLYAATDSGLIRFEENGWIPVTLIEAGDILSLSSDGNDLFVLIRQKGEHQVYRLKDGIAELVYQDPERELRILAFPDYLIDNQDLYRLERKRKKLQLLKTGFLGEEILSTAKLNGELWVGSKDGLYRYTQNQIWLPEFPVSGDIGWAPQVVIALTVDDSNVLWMACSQGLARYQSNSWDFYNGQDGLPYNRFTCAGAGNGLLWLGTDKGLIRFDGKTWRYRQGKRWLPDDRINDLAVDSLGNVWAATRKGIALIERLPMTFAEKAAWYEDEINRYHRRTPFEFVNHVGLERPGDKSIVHQQDSDNDGLWTSMYGAGECYAYGATGDLSALQRSRKVFEALHVLGKVTQGGTHPAPPGFVARTILPTSGPNPNLGRLERDKIKKETDDALWKVIDPRWPVSEDGQWYWKCDTSSDELDGHYYFYGLYYDLVASETEKTRVRQHVAALTDHLIRHEFQMVDHDGLPTRWARFNPYELNHDVNWAFDRGLNSLSMLSYLVTTAHITQDDKYIRYAEYLVENHGYLQNAQMPKTQRGPGTGNQSDDEMAFMCLYNFIKYAPNPEWRDRIALACWTYGRLEAMEMNPFFNFIWAVSCREKTFSDAWGTYSLDPTGDWLQDAVETLKRFPLDRFNWSYENSHRLDIIFLDENSRHFDEGSYRGRGLRVNGKVLPIDERFLSHWNHDPFRLDSDGDGRILADGAAFLLPYYMGLYYQFIE